MILKPDKQYTFSEIFELNVDIAELLNELGYSYGIQRLDLPRYSIPDEVVQNLQGEFYRHIPRIEFTSEMARREFIISDILKDMMDHVEFRIRSEYKISNERLRGSLDYLLQGEKQFVVIEAKNDEIERGFRQLAVELITAAELLECEQLYGAVTTGEIWKFGLIDRNQHTITRDVNTYTIPTGLADLMNTLAGLIV